MIKDKLFWMQTLSDFFAQENLWIEPDKKREGRYILSSGEFGRIATVRTVADIFDQLEIQIQESYVGDLKIESQVYGLKLPDNIFGKYDASYWEYWVVLRDDYEAGRLLLPEGGAKEYFERHDYEFDVLELGALHVVDFSIKEWLEKDTCYHTYRIGCSWTLYGHITVRARNKTEAIVKARKEAETCSLPEDGEYLDDSFELDEENVEAAD